MTETTSDPNPGFPPPHPPAGSEVEPVLLDLAAALDGRLEAPVLVLPLAAGSRRLVLAGASADLATLEGWLAGEGFVQRGPVWADFGVDGARAVQLLPLPAENGAAFAGASPIWGATHLVQPAPSVTPELSASAARDARGAAARHGGSARVSISGPDGTGKSTQLAQLRAALESVGMPVAVAWAPTITRTRSYSRSAPAKQPEAGGTRTPASATPTTETAPASAPSGRRRRPLLLEHGWATAIALRNAAEMWRHVLKAPRGHALLLDRFSLDAEVKLQYWYGHRRGLKLGFQRRLFRAVAPSADVAVLLVVPAERNRARRPEDWTSEQLAVFWRLYPEIAATLGAVVIDGDRPIPEVAADVARTVWRQLP